MEDHPSSGASEQAPRLDLTGTDGCGGGIRVFSVASMFSGYKDIYIGGRRAPGEPEGAHEGGGGLDPRGRLFRSLACTPSLLGRYGSKNNSPEGFILFGLRLISLFCETRKWAKKQQFALGLGLVG